MARIGVSVDSGILPPLFSVGNSVSPSRTVISTPFGRRRAGPVLACDRGARLGKV